MDHHRLPGNKPLLLEESQTCWVVQSGTVALFRTAVNSGAPEGARRYLFSVGPGEAMFGGVAVSEYSHHGLLAVAIEETRLQRLSQNDIRKQFASDPGKLHRLVETWMSKLGRLVAPDSPPQTRIQASGEPTYTLQSGEYFEPGPRGITWARIQSGTISWMGFEELPLGAMTVPIPLVRGMCLQAYDTVELEALTTHAALDSDIWLDSLSFLLKPILQYTESLNRHEAHTAFRQFQEQERLNQHRQQNTLENIASVLQPKTSPLPSSDGEPLLIAAQAVGDALGVNIRPPAKSEDLTRLKVPLEAIARSSHIRMRPVLLTDKWWTQDNGPLCAYMQPDDRPVALLQQSPTRYDCFDPTTMSRTPVDARLASMLDPVAYAFYRPFSRAALNAIDLLKFGLQDYSKELYQILLCAVVTTLLGMLTPQMTAVLVDQAIPDADRAILIQIGFALLAAAFGQVLFQLAQGFALIRYQTGSKYASQAAMWDRLLNLKPTFFRQFAVGDLSLRVTAISTIREKLSGTTMSTLLSSFLALLNLGLMFYYSAQLALVATVVALLAILATTYSGYLTIQQIRPLQKLMGDLFGITVQLINGVNKLRVAGAEERAFAYWGDRFSHQQRLLRRIRRLEDSLAVFNAVLPTLASAVIFWFVVLEMQTDQTGGPAGLTAGAFLAFNAAYGTFISGATSLSNTVIDLLEVSTLWERARPILEGAPEVDDDKTDPGRLTGKLALEHVTFRYQEDSPVILDDVSIHAEPGEFIALVGPSGCGKSTTLRLLLGFEKPESGTVYYDDQDLARLDIYAVRRQVGTVLQYSKLTSAAIYENIAGGSSITLDEAWEAAGAAGLAEDIRDMPMGMYTYISEGGTNLSGGQRQRLLVARALVLRPKIVLFDEATSALDNRTQAIVSESLERMRATRIVIAHRLSTIQNADRIYVINQGRVVQQGTYDELASQDGLFAQLMARQTL